LTADTQSLSKLVPPSSSTNDVIAFQRCLLAGCHSLVYFTDSSKGKQRFVGDPLDEAALRFSGWKYNQTNSQFFLSMVKAQLAEPSDPVALWQIKSFPFDPNRRLSTAIVLIKRKDSSFELWRVTKGAPDTLQHSFTTQSNDDLSTFQHQKRELERNGYRSIAMGAENLTKSPLALSLFPEGLSSSPSDLAFARSQGDDLLREDIEGLKTTEPMLTNYGFACFDASLRRSSPRIVRELKKAGIACIMLTGDSTDAAINIATRVDIVSTRKIGILELSEIDGETKLLRRSMTLGNEDASKSGTTELLTVKSARRILSQQAKAKLSLIASGDAIDHILGNVQNDVHRMIIQNLGSISVIARATPELKKKVVQALKNECGKTVMMCGTLLVEGASCFGFDLQLKKAMTLFSTQAMV
jgi:magnesium-transporting ATPase (P-type)